MKIIFALVILMFALLIFCAVDCSCGTNRHLDCVVLNHCYKPAWTEVEMHTDENGHTSVSTTRHSEEFHVICKSSDDIVDVSSTRAIYYAATNSQPVVVVCREGKWTHSKYIPYIEPESLSGKGER